MISGIVADAVDQLQSENLPSADFRVVWIHCKGHIPDVLAEQAVATLYGVADVIDWDGEEGFNGKVFYFDESDFFRHREILDGAVVSYEVDNEYRAMFCVNDNSARYVPLRKSDLCAAFSSITDPRDVEESAESIVLRCTLDRRDEHQILEHLKRKYGMGLPKRMPMQHISATVVVPSNEI